MDEATDLALICRVRAQLCALPIEFAVETLRPLPIEPVTGAPHFVRGLAVIRGEPVPVVDAARLLGIPDSPLGRFVTIRVGLRRIALAVTSVPGIRPVATSALRAWPPLLHDAAADVVETIGLLDAELLLVLRGAKLLPEAALVLPDAAQGPS